jgi:aminoglycoside 6-adenylyltransferase
MDTRVAAFLDELAAWAREQIDVRAAVLLGSQARVDSAADRFSDVDVVLFADDPARYLDDTRWLQRFGDPLLTFLEPTPVGGFVERRVLFRDGLEVDFSVPPAAALEALPLDAGPVFARGFRILYDDGRTLDFPEGEIAEPAPPTQAELDRLANDFWYRLLWAAKKVARGEVLLAKQVCDCFLTGHLVQLARWRAQGVDTWHGLRFFERWAGEEVVDALGRTFAMYDADDIRRALRATAELFGRLEDDVARRFALASPVDRAEILARFEALAS